LFREEALAEGKPPQVVDKIAEGKMEKYYQEIVLLEQAFIKDPQVMIKDLINEITAKTGESISIRRFQRFELGIDGNK